jgi:cytochrome c oxidase subunit 1
MTLLEDRPVEEVPEPQPRRATGIVAFCTTTDHKRIGVAYMVTAFVFFLIGGAMAEVIRAQLAQPDMDVVSEDTYNQLFTMHGTIMLLLFVSPFAIGLANYLVPLQIGARDVAFPRLNALSYWLTLFAGIVMMGGFVTADGAAKFGWYAYAPLTSDVRTPGLGGDLWVMGIALLGASGVMTAVNLVATISTMRARGMTFFRMPIFTWNMFVVSLLILMVFPVLTAAGVMLFTDRHFDTHIFDAAQGGFPVLWQHLFWWFGHPEVYILVLPFFGVFTEIFATFSKRPVFGYRGFVLATLAIGFLSVGVWAHHMFTTGVIVLSFFSISTMVIAVPTGVKFFGWIATMWGGKLNFKQPLLWGIAFLFTFLLGGLTGPMLASAPLDFHLSDSYFVVAHFHYVLFGGSVFGIFAAVYYWFPKITGRMLSERLGAVHLVLTFVGFHLTFLVQHILGLEGMARRLRSYYEADGFGPLNLVSTIGAFLLGIAILPFLWNVWRSWRRGPPAGDNPWDGQTLEWWTSSPPPPDNFDRLLPPIRSERPAWDANHPDDLSTGVH